MGDNNRQEEYLDYKGLCHFLRIAYSTARKWKSQGRITYTRLNSKVYFPKGPILRELRKNTIRSVSTMMEERSGLN